MAENFMLYKPNNKGTGFAFSFQLSYKKDTAKGSPWFLFMEASNQMSGTEVKTAKFNWEKKISVKLGLPDIGEMIATLDGRQGQAGGNRDLYHQSPDGGNKIIALKYLEDKGCFGLKVSAQSADKQNTSQAGILLTQGEACLLKELLSRAVVRLLEW